MDHERIKDHRGTWATDFGVTCCVNYFGRKTVFIDKQAIERVIEGLEYQMLGIKL